MSPNEYPNSESEWTAVFTGVSREWMNQCAGMILSVTPSAVHLLRIETHPMNQIWAWLVFLHSSEVLEFTLKTKYTKGGFYRDAMKNHFWIPKEPFIDVTYDQVWWPILGICALHLTHPKCTHTAVNTHTPGAVGSHLCCGARGAVGGSVPCSRVSPQSWYWGWRECSTFTPPTYNSCRPETRTHNLSITSPTL